MTLSCTEFIGRFLLHVLPSGFQKVRAYGFLAPRHKAGTLASIRSAFGALPPRPPPKDEPASDRILRLTGVDVTLCPVCKTAHLAFTREIPRIRAGPAA